MENTFSIPIQIVDSLPPDLESRLTLPENIAFQSSLEHFLVFSEICEYRIEFHEGFIISFYDNIFGQMFNHERIITNFLFVIKGFIKSNKLKWEVLSSNISIYIHLPKPSVYKPDASVFKENPQIMTYINPKNDSKHEAAKNPCAVFEVLSKSTQKFDLTEKLANYKKIASLEQIVFAKQNEIYVLIYEKIGDHWFDNTYTDPNEVILIADCPVLLADLYENVDFNK